MATLTPDQLRTRERVETAIRLMAPALNLVLQAGERLSKIVEPEDPEYYPPRAHHKTAAEAAGKPPPQEPAHD